MIQAVVFDIGGIFEVISEGGDPTSRFPQMIARWEERLHMLPGTLGQRLVSADKELVGQGKDISVGTCTEEEWLMVLQAASGMNTADFQTFIRDYWDVYTGEINYELLGFFKNLRPPYQTALLSNSGVGARREEEARFHFSEFTDIIIYSHEVGFEKPDPRIYAITCERLGRQPQEIVFLDDNLTNVTAAKQFGLHAILFQNNAQAIRDIQASLQ